MLCDKNNCPYCQDGTKLNEVSLENEYTCHQCKNGYKLSQLNKIYTEQELQEALKKRTEEIIELNRKVILRLRTELTGEHKKARELFNIHSGFILAKINTKIKQKYLDVKQ